MSLNLPIISPIVKNPKISAMIIPSDASCWVLTFLIRLRIPPMLIESAVLLAVPKKALGFRIMCVKDVK